MEAPAAAAVLVEMLLMEAEVAGSPAMAEMEAHTAVAAAEAPQKMAVPEENTVETVAMVEAELILLHPQRPLELLGKLGLTRQTQMRSSKARALVEQEELSLLGHMHLQEAPAAAVEVMEAMAVAAAAAALEEVIAEAAVAAATAEMAEMATVLSTWIITYMDPAAVAAATAEMAETGLKRIIPAAAAVVMDYQGMGGKQGTITVMGQTEDLLQAVADVVPYRMIAVFTAGTVEMA